MSAPAVIGQGEPVVVAEQLTKRYGTTTAVDALDLALYPGEVFGLLGPNGAGKTTTILMLLGLSEPTGGRCRVAGLDPTRQPLEVKRQVGYMPDAVGFYPDLTGRQNLRFTARLNGLDGAEGRIDALLEEVGLAHAADDRVATYSRGMRQRLGLADALVKDPSIVILDEPTIAIDPEGVDEVLRLIRRLATDRGACVLLSSHLLYQVEAVCDRVGIFVAGRMVARGTTAELAAGVGGDRQVLDVVVEGDAASAVAALQGLEGVEEVARDDHRPDRLVVTSAADVRRRVLRALVDADVAVVELRRRDAALDELYRRYFRTAEEAAA